MQYTKERAKNVAGNAIGLKNQSVTEKVIVKMAMEHQEIPDKLGYRTILIEFFVIGLKYVHN